MTLQKIEVDVPKGWRAVGVRLAKRGDYYLGPNGPLEATTDFDTSVVVILEKEPPLPRTPTASDVNTIVEVSDDATTWHKRKLLAVLPPHILAAYVAEIEGEQEVDTWRYARVIEEVKKPGYRTPTAADVGRNIQASNNGNYWETGTFVGAYMNKYVIAEGNGFYGYTHARILDDGTVKPKPREWWIRCSTRIAYSSEDEAGAHSVHVREVIE